MKHMQPFTAVLSPHNACSSRVLCPWWWDSITHDPVILDYLLDLVGPEKIAMGSDYPFPLGRGLHVLL